MKLVIISAISILALSFNIGKENSQQISEENLQNYSNPILRKLLGRSSKVFIAAHRGGYENDKADKATENSVANIQNCIKKGYELFETDIQRTLDGHFVMVHDPTIERETTGKGKVSNMNLVDLKALHKRYRDSSVSEHRVATFEEFLEAGKTIMFKADMKRGVSMHFAEIMKLVTAHNALESVIFRVSYREADFFKQYIKNGGTIAKHTLMFKVNSIKQIDVIKNCFDSSTIEITLNKKNPVNETTLNLIKYATSQGFIVETHADGSKDDWVKLIKAGVCMFHTKTPSEVQALLKTLP